MNCRQTTQEVLFPAPVVQMSAHLAWSSDRGWTVHIWHRHEGQETTSSCPAEQYGPLSFSEAGQVVDAVVLDCLPWIADQR